MINTRKMVEKVERLEVNMSDIFMTRLHNHMVKEGETVGDMVTKLMMADTKYRRSRGTCRG